MRIAFTTSGVNLEAPLDGRFGRAERFLIYDTEQDTFELKDNLQNVQAAQGAGIQAAETLSRAAVDSLVTGHCGPNAFRVLVAAGIRIYNTDSPTVADALRRFRAGELTPAGAPDVEGHWG